MRNTQFFASFSLAALLSISSSQAATVVSNLGESSLGFAQVNDAQAVRFNTGDAPAGVTGWTINSITITMNRAATSGELLGVGIRADNFGVPDNTALALGIQSFDFSGTADLTYDTVGDPMGNPVSLAPNTSYWISVVGPNEPPTATSWAYTGSTAESGLPGWTIDSRRYQEPFGPNNGWNQAAPDEDSAYLFSIDATPIPEPASLALLGLGGLALLRRRR